MTTNVIVAVQVNSERRSGRTHPAAVALTVLFVAWVMGWLWWLLGGTSLLIAVWSVHKAHLNAVAARTAIAARADQQHSWVLAGDPRGIYGDTEESFCPASRKLSFR